MLLLDGLRCAIVAIAVAVVMVDGRGALTGTDSRRCLPVDADTVPDDDNDNIVDG